MCRFFVSLLILVFCQFSFAQNQTNIPTEIYAGNKATGLSSFWFRDLDSAKKIELFVYNQFEKHYTNPKLDFFLTQALLTYYFTPNIGLAGGVNYANGELYPTLAANFYYSLPKQHLEFVGFPYLEFRDSLHFGFFGFIFYEPLYGRKLKGFNQLQFDLQFNKNGFFTSGQQLRLGAHVGKFQTGAAINLSQTKIHQTYNFGLFLRREF